MMFWVNNKKLMDQATHKMFVIRMNAALEAVKQPVPGALDGLLKGGKA